MVSRKGAYPICSALCGTDITDVIPAFDRLIFGQSQEGACLSSSILRTQNGFSYLVLVSILLDLLPLYLSDDMSCS